MLTQEQQELVERNMNLAKKKAWRWKWKLDDFHYFSLKECLSMCYEGLCKAAQGWDETKEVKFSTYAYRCMDNEFYLWFKNNTRQKRDAFIEIESLFNVIHVDNDGVELQLIDSIPVDMMDETENHIQIDTLMSKLTQKEIDHLTMYYLENKTYKEIGDYYGTSYQNAQQTIKNAITKCKNTIPREEFNRKTIKLVGQYTLEGELINKFKSAKEAADFLGNPNAHSNIISCCKGRKKSIGGYKWKFIDELNVG